MSEPLKIAVLGATGAVGGAVLRALDASELDIVELLPVAGLSTRTPKVEFRRSTHTLRQAADEDLFDADLAFCALPLGLARELGDPVVEAGVRLVDLTGAWSAESPPVGLGFDTVEPGLEDSVVSAPGPVGLALAHLGAAVSRAGELISLRATGLVAATIAGRAGMEELSGQVVAMFNSQEPPRKTFPDGLAFDVLPAWGGADESGWTTAERLAAHQATELLGLDAAAVAVSLAVAPTFSGLTLSVACRGRGGVENVRAAIEQDPVLQWMDRMGDLRPLSMLDSPRIAVGRLREDPDGDGVHLWAACDPLWLCAAHAVGLSKRWLETS